MTDEQIEDLIEQSGGRWHEDEFRISAREIMDFARALLSASIADTAGAKPVAYEVHWPNGEHELIYASALRMISDLGDFTLTELYAATPASSVAECGACPNGCAIQCRVEAESPPITSAPSVADAAGAKPVALTDEQIVRAIRKANIALVNGLGEKAAANAFRSALPDGEALASVKNEPIAWAVPVEIEHLQKGYRNSAVICNRNEGAYTLPVYFEAASRECAKSPEGHPCNLAEGHEGPCGVSECNVPPEGWRCTRQAGHEGPCAAIKKGESDAAMLRRLAAGASEGQACHKCGLPMSVNPHPEAGKPPHYLEVGCPKECVPCLVKNRHGWAQKAMKASAELTALRERAAGIRLEALKEARHVVYMALSLNDAFNAIEALVDKEPKQ